MHTIVNIGLLQIVTVTIIFLTLYFQRDVGFFGGFLSIFRVLLYFSILLQAFISVWVHRNKQTRQKIFSYLLGVFAIVSCLVMILFNSEVIYAREILYFNNNPHVFTENQDSNVAILRSRNFVSYVYAPGYETIPEYIQDEVYSISCHYRLSENWYICSVGT